MKKKCGIDKYVFLVLFYFREQNFVLKTYGQYVFLVLFYFREQKFVLKT